ncbi:uncharacterized protein BT62DRAFT_833007, partial [Guyanagaster necrorhizus]
GPDDEPGALNPVTPAMIQLPSPIQESIAISLNLELDRSSLLAGHDSRYGHCCPAGNTGTTLIPGLAVIPFSGYQANVLTLNTQV